MNYFNRFTLVAAALSLAACAATPQIENAEDALETAQDVETAVEVAEQVSELIDSGESQDISDDSAAVGEDVGSGASTDVAGSGDADGSAAAEQETTDDSVVRPTVPAQLQGAEQLLEQKSFFFDFDMESLKDDAFDALDAHAIAIGLAIAENPGLVVTVEGHADERGTQEYNIALGMRRAESVSRYLRAKGIPAANLSTVSFGEAKPLELGSDEVSWAANRRAVLDY